MAVDASKARQLSLIEALGLATPRTLVIHRRSELAEAARAIGFPLLVKANIADAEPKARKTLIVRSLFSSVKIGA